MFRERLATNLSRIRRALARVAAEERSPREMAASFAIGIFVTALPTGGLGLGALFALDHRWEWTSTVGLVGAVAVCNPLVKPAIYAGSFAIGAVLFGVEPIVPRDVGILEYVVVLAKVLLVGNVLIAACLAAGSYLVVLELVRSHRNRIPTTRS